MLYKNTIIPIDAHDDEISFVFLGGYYGHKDVVIKSVKSGNVEAFVSGALDFRKRDALLPYPVIRINHLAEGAYEIYSTDHNHTERSISAFVTLSGDSAYQTLQKCSELSHAGAEKLLEAFSSGVLDGTSVIPLLREKYLAAKTDDDKLALAKLLMSAISVLNRRMQGGQVLVEDDFSFEAEKLNAEPDCDHVLRKDIITNEIQQCIPLDIGGVDMPEENDHLYLYTEVDKYGVPIGFLVSYRLDPVTYGVLKEDEMHSDTLYKSAVEKATSMTKENIEFSTADEPFLAILNELQPASPYLHAPSLDIENGRIAVTFDGEDKNIIALFPDRFRLAINPVDLALDPAQRIAVNIPGDDFAFFSLKVSLGSEDCVYWIEDDSGNIVSDIAALRMKDDFLNQVEASVEANKELNRRIRLLFTRKYQKHLLPFLKANYPECTPIVQDALSYCEMMDMPSQDIASTVITQCMGSGRMSSMPGLITAMMKDKTVYGDYVIDFFKSPLPYKHGNFTLAMPPESNVLYKVERYSYSDGRKVRFYRSAPHEAVDCHFYDCDFAVFSAIDIETGKSSGFLMFDFGEDGRTKITKFLVDEKEAV